MMVEEKGSKLESKGGQAKEEREFNQEHCERHGRTQTNTDEHGRTRTNTDEHGRTRTNTDRHRRTRTDTDEHGQTQTNTDINVSSAKVVRFYIRERQG